MTSIRIKLAKGYDIRRGSQILALILASRKAKA